MKVHIHWSRLSVNVHETQLGSDKRQGQLWKEHKLINIQCFRDSALFDASEFLKTKENGLFGFYNEPNFRIVNDEEDTSIPIFITRYLRINIDFHASG